MGQRRRRRLPGGRVSLPAQHGHCRTAFVEDGGDVHLARNEGSDPVELDAIFLARTGTKEFLIPVTQPKGCHD